MSNCKDKMYGERNSAHNPNIPNRISLDANEPVVYLHPRRKSNKASGLRRRKSCVNRFCVGICNLFNRLKPTEYEEERQFLHPSISSLHNHGCMNTLVPKMRPMEESYAHPTFKYGEKYWNNTDSKSDGNEDYIIYIPRVQRSKYRREPLAINGANSYNSPIFIHSCSKNVHYDDCCPFAPSTMSQQDTPMQNHKEENHGTRFHHHIPGTPHSHRRMRKYHTSCRTSLETMSECGCQSRRVQEDAKRACGDSRDVVTDKLEKKCMVSEGSKPVSLYIPNGSKFSDGNAQHSFKTYEKNICWTSIKQRHSTAARNRQNILQEIKDRLQTYSAIWTRRRLIGEKKKFLLKDSKSAYVTLCPPPNMLESRFHHIHWLGNSGNHNNSVGRYFDKEENRVVALKIFSDKLFETIVDNLDNKLMAIQEVNSLKIMNHKNIVQLFGYFELHDKYHLIMESCDHSLREEIEEAPSGLGTSVSKKMIKHILNGLHYCHQVKCLHRDLSPENILVCKNGLAKIADFDRSVFLHESVANTSPTPGSYVYNSPEILAGDKEYGLPSDVWSLGIIFCELLTGKPPWNGKSAQSQLREIHNCVGPLLPRHASVAKLQVDEKSYTVHNHAQLQQMFTTISAPCCSFIMKCLDVNPLCRFTCGELLQHQFMKGNYK